MGRRSLLALVLLAGCAARKPLPVYALPAPVAPEEPEHEPFVPRETDVPVAVALLAGEVAPGDGVLVPATEHLECTWDVEMHRWWRGVAVACYERAADDRLHCEDVAAQRGEQFGECVQEVRAQRWAGQGMLVGGLLLGLLLGGLLL